MFDWVACIIDTDPKPSRAGWYPVQLCWDVEEGVFPDAAYWDGAKWLGNASSAVSFWMPGVYVTSVAARHIAKQYDMGI